jgi:DNA mismatch repair protein MutS2
MLYPTLIEEKIGFDRIRKRLLSECHTELGRRIASEMVFMTRYEEVNYTLCMAWEFVVIKREEDSFEVGYFTDLSGVLQSIRPLGTWLTQQSFHDLRKSLETLDKTARFFRNERVIKYPLLSDRASKVLLFPELLQSIKRIIDDNGEIKDNASPRLHEIRQELRSVQQSLSKRIQRVLDKARADGLVESDASPSIRDGRLVIPVEARNKRKINGIIHDESATGKTAYIEPSEVVEANNRIRELEMEEKREVVKILIELTSLIRPRADEMVESFGFLGLIDFLRSKSVLTAQLKAINPVVKNECVVQWRNALHPLLYLAFRKEGKQVVPLNIELTESDRILLISGPNAGGKSVCLKTVGLIQYMLQCGLPVPVNESSVMGIFDDVFIDIGDEQSLDNDLSTYSSHLMNMKHFLRHAGEKSLLLIDEFGTGTEPQIGGAIAEAILEQLNTAGAFGVITTHYSNLKHFASQTAGIMNAAMLFDQQNMQPLFSLHIGKPGSSYAVEMARKIGIPESVIKSASDKIGQDTLDFDKHLREIIRDKSYWERKREDIRKQNKQIETLQASYEESLKKVKEERKRIIDDAKSQAAMLLDKTNATIENTIRQIREAEAEKEKTRLIRRTFEEVKEEVSNAGNDDEVIRKMEKILRRENRKVNEIKPGKAEKGNEQKPAVKKQSPILAGDTVRMLSRDAYAEVLSVKGNKLELALGQIRISVKTDEVEKVSRKEARKASSGAARLSANFNADIQKRKLNFKHDIDLRGMRGEEAVAAVTTFMDDAVMVGASTVRILHGTGTGALRQLIRQYLATVPFVATFRDEHVQMGGAGITVVEMEY